NFDEVAGVGVGRRSEPTSAGAGRPSEPTSARAGRIGVILDRTCFYAEAGGQVGDIGRLQGRAGEFRVEDTRAFGGYILHIGSVVRGEIRAGDTVQLNIDNARRLNIAANHTA